MPLFFDGADDVVAYPASIRALMSGAARFTMLGWFMPRAVVANRAFLELGESGGNIQGFRLSHGSLSASAVLVGVGNGGTTLNFGNTAAGKLVAGHYVHLAVAFNGAGSGNAQRLQCIVNGVNEPLTFDGTIDAALPASITTALLELGHIAIDAVFTNMEAALVRLYSAHLSPEEVAAEMHHYLPQRTQDLVAFQILDDANAVALDSSGQGNHGAITGAIPARGPFALMPPVSY